MGVQPWECQKADQKFRSVAWLKRQGMSIDEVLAALKDVLPLTKDSGQAAFYSTSLGRSLQLAAHVWQDRPIPTEGLLLGALMASRENLNTLGALLENACGEKDLLELLLNELPFANAKLATIPREHSLSLHLQWSDPIPSENALPIRDPFPDQIRPAATQNTHWVIPGRLAAGVSAGNLPSSSLTALVNAGVDTFVSLQKSYREYGSSDYRETLRTLAKRPDFPPHPLSFLHFPIPVFGVVKDPDMLALINQLADLLKKGKCLYIHCFGGHGRTGVVLLLLLSATLGQDMKASMELLKTAHKARGCRYCAINEGELGRESAETGRKIGKSCIQSK